MWYLWGKNAFSFTVNEYEDQQILPIIEEEDVWEIFVYFALVLKHFSWFVNIHITTETVVGWIMSMFL